MEKYINEIIDIIENYPELNKQKIIEKFCKNTDRKFTTPELQDIYNSLSYNNIFYKGVIL